MPHQQRTIWTGASDGQMNWTDLDRLIDLTAKLEDDHKKSYLRWMFPSWRNAFSQSGFETSEAERQVTGALPPDSGRWLYARKGRRTDGIDVVRMLVTSMPFSIQQIEIRSVN
jgi:hypothetical protein